VDNSGPSDTKYCVRMKGRDLVPSKGVSGERERRSGHQVVGKCISHIYAFVKLTKVGFAMMTSAEK